LVWRRLVIGIGHRLGDRGFQRIQDVVQHDARALAPVVEHEERMDLMVCAQMKLQDILLVIENII
jgi:hypothetical protein